MTDNEIIKALERMSAEDADGFSSDILDLIRRQQAEIERSKAEITRNEVKLLKIEKLHNEQKAIADSRKLDMDYFINENERLYSEIKKAKTEAITEFAEQLHKKEDVYDDGNYWFYFIDPDEMDELVKEMVGENNG